MGIRLSNNPVVIFVASTMVLLFGAAVAGSQTAKSVSTAVKKTVSLKSGDNTILLVELENTHSRSHVWKMDAVENSCTLPNGVEGVVWIVTIRSEKDLTPSGLHSVAMQDEKGRSIKQRCWFTEGQHIVWFAAVGPEDSKTITVRYGEATADISVAQ